MDYRMRIQGNLDPSWEVRFAGLHFPRNRRVRAVYSFSDRVYGF